RRRRSTRTSATVVPSASRALAPSHRQASEAGMRTEMLMSVLLVPRVVVVADPLVHVARHVVLVVVVGVHVLELDDVVALHRGVVHRVAAVLVEAVLDVALGRLDGPR